MNDLPPDLPRLRTLETWLALQLHQVRHAIQAAERREAEQQQAVEARPLQPDWMLEGGLSQQAPPVYLHVGGCHMAGKRVKGVPRDVALRALTEGIDACPHCRPDSELGYMEG